MKNYETLTFAKLQEMLGEIYPDPPARQPHHRAPCAANNTRMHRALSWLERYAIYESIENNPKMDMAVELAEERFLCLWLSFNAAYGNDDFIFKSDRPNEQEQIENLFKKVLDFCKNDDASMRLLVCAIKKYKEKIIALAKIPFLYQQLWRAEQNCNPEKYHAWVHADEQSKEHHKTKNEIRRRIAMLSPEHISPADRGNVYYVLHQTFERLRILRNQVIHGSSEYAEEYNRSSIALGIAVLRACLPEILHVMLTAMHQDRNDDRWGRVAYPPYLNKPDNSENPPKNNEDN